MYAQQYILAIKVGARLVIDMTTATLYPVAAFYLSELIKTINIAST